LFLWRARPRHCLVDVKLQEQN